MSRFSLGFDINPFKPEGQGVIGRYRHEWVEACPIIFIKVSGVSKGNIYISSKGAQSTHELNCRNNNTVYCIGMLVLRQ